MDRSTIAMKNDNNIMHTFVNGFDSGAISLL